MVVNLSHIDIKRLVFCGVKVSHFSEAIHSTINKFNEINIVIEIADDQIPDHWLVKLVSKNLDPLLGCRAGWFAKRIYDLLFGHANGKAVYAS